MSDLVGVVRTLTEALADIDRGTSYMNLRRGAKGQALAAAARAVAEGVPIQWCEVHGDWSATHLGDGTMCRWAVKVNSDKTCSIVSRLLVDYPKEETP